MQCLGIMILCFFTFSMCPYNIPQFKRFSVTRLWIPTKNTRKTINRRHEWKPPVPLMAIWWCTLSDWPTGSSLSEKCTFEYLHWHNMKHKTSKEYFRFSKFTGYKIWRSNLVKVTFQNSNMLHFLFEIRYQFSFIILKRIHKGTPFVIVKRFSFFWNKSKY